MHWEQAGASQCARLSSFQTSPMGAKDYTVSLEMGALLTSGLCLSYTLASPCLSVGLSFPTVQ